MRTDIHSPKNLKPEDYTLVGFIIDPISDEAAEIAEERVGYAEYVNGTTADCIDEVPEPRFAGNHERKGTCDHCGAAFIYKAVYRHAGGEHIVVGLDCATNAFPSTNLEHDRKQLAKARKARKSRIESDRLESEFFAEYPQYAWVKGSWIDNIVHQVRAGRPITERQFELLERETLKMDMQKRDSDCEQGEAWTGGITQKGKRFHVVGTILGTKMVEGYYGAYTHKMLVQAGEDKIWTTVPGDLEYGYELKGAGVEFDVALEEKEPGFYIGKRPTKPQTLFERVA